jgi:dTDP-4-dehydrorhamnose reductase
MVDRMCSPERDLGPRLFLVGATGTVGSAVSKVAEQQGLAVVAPSRRELDMIEISEDDLRRVIEGNRSDVILNCVVARVTIDEAEKERGNDEGIVWQTNVGVPEKIARVCKGCGVTVVHFSTDYVLGGEKWLHKEDEEVAPTSWYAISKAEAERRVLEVGGKVQVVRVQRPFSYNPEAKRGDFLRDAYRAISGGGKYYGIGDQYFSPGLDLDCARAALAIAGSREYGIWHVSSPTVTTPYEAISLALEELDELGVELEWSLLERVPFAHLAERFGWGDLRPKHTAFDISKFESHFGKGTLRPLPEMIKEWARGMKENLG